MNTGALAALRRLAGGLGSMRRSAATSLFLSIVGAGMGFLIQLVLARSMGPESFGTYIYAMGLMNVALIPAKLDFDNAATRFMGAYAGNLQWAKARGFLHAASRYALASAALVTALALIALYMYQVQSATRLDPVYWFACALLPLTVATQVQANTLQGFNRIIASQAPSGILRPVLVIVLLGASTLAGINHISAAHVAAFNIGALVIVILVQRFFVVKALQPAAGVPPDTSDSRLWLRTALGLFAVSLAQFVLSGQTDVVLVGSLLSKTDAGHYAIASQIIMVLLMACGAVIYVSAPRIAQLHAAHSHDDLQALVRRVRTLNLLVTIPTALVIIASGRLILGLFGPSFLEAYPVLLILSVVALQAAVGGGIAGFLVSMTGHEVAGAMITGACAVVYLAMAIGLAPTMGATGIAAATATAYVLRLVALDAYVYRHLKVEVLPLGRRQRDAAARAGG